MKRVLISHLALVLAIPLAGCIHSNQHRLVGIHQYEGPPHPLRSYDDLQYLSCDYRRGRPGILYAPEDPALHDERAGSQFNLSPQHLERAARVWPYALMSSNVYRADDTPVYEIPGWVAERRWESPSGLAVEEWVGHDSTGALREIALVFEGTTFNSLADWRTNFAVIEPRQHREAMEIVGTVRAKADSMGIPLVVTGHSLGAALALNMSRRVPDLSSYGFNPSPRAFYGRAVESDAEQVWVYESGEVLGYVRVPWKWRLNRYEPLRYNFLAFIRWRSVKGFEEHSMYLMARGLLLAAIKHEGDDGEAARAFAANLDTEGYARAFQGEAPKADIAECERIFSLFRE